MATGQQYLQPIIAFGNGYTFTCGRETCVGTHMVMTDPRMRGQNGLYTYLDKEDNGPRYLLTKAHCLLYRHACQVCPHSKGLFQPLGAPKL